MRRPKLTQRQKDILYFIIKYREKHGYPPTIREIGDEFEIHSPNGVKDHLKSLARKGYITLHARTSRGIELPGKKPPGVPLSPRVTYPLVGEVAAGGPILASKSEAEQFIVEDFFPKDDDVFAVKVEGESMINAGIRPGDVVLAKQSDSADKGDIVVAVIGEEVTVKTFASQSSRGLRLNPENPKFEPIVSRDAQILGVVVGLMRRY